MHADGSRTTLPLVIGLALGSVVSLGLARFAYSLLLPPMRADLDWTFAQAGFMNTANAVGYLVGAIVTGSLARHIGARPTFLAGMIVATLSLVGSALTADFAAQLALRVIAGLGSAFTFIGGAALVAALGSHRPDRAGVLLSVYTAGAGAGIVLSGLTVQPLVAGSTGNWRWAWAGLAVASAVATLATLPALRATDEPDPLVRRFDPAVPDIARRGRIAAIGVPAVAYLLFGAGYIAYLTFVIAYLREAGASTAATTWFWIALGSAALIGVPLWGRVLDRFPSGYCLAAISATLLAATVVVLASGSTATGLVSAGLFGGSFLAVPAGMAHLTRHRLPATAWTATIAELTVAFAIGQCIGPALAGILADRSGGARVGLILAAVLLTATALTYLAGRDRTQASTSSA